MEYVPDGTRMFLHAAHVGDIRKLKKFAAALEHVLGDGIPSVVENTKDEKGRRAIHFAASKDRLNVLKYLIEKMHVSIDVRDGSGQTPLSCAAVEGRLAAMEYLLQMGANPEIPDDLNRSPLHHVAMKGHNDAIPLLLSKGVNVDITNGFGSPLISAAYFGNHDTVKLLLDHGANPNLFHDNTLTPLLASVYCESWQCVELLLKAGADPNLGPDGFTPLLIAAEEPTKIINLLVEAGADPNVTNTHGLKPIEVAAVNGNRRGVEILFPITPRIPSYVDWSMDGIMKRAKSKEFAKKIVPEEEDFLEAKSRGTSAFHRKDYWLAVNCYSEALNMKPDDAAVLSNRSMCYAYLNEGDLALKDATQCVLERPDWPKAYYRKGVALKLLNRLGDAANAFFEGLKLDNKNKELEDAFREVTLDRLKALDVQL